jgi:hypothetical protein
MDRIWYCFVPLKTAAVSLQDGLSDIRQIMQVTLFNETVGQGEGCVSWVDISFDYSSIIFCAEGNIQLKHNVPWYFHQGNIS